MAQLQKDADVNLPARRVHVFYDEATRQKINRHLSDINDTISDDDIRNVITDIRSDSTDSHGKKRYKQYLSPWRKR
ncbi:MAG: hypothetical protein ABIO82_05630 [Ginsengibacter sp.]